MTPVARHARWWHSLYWRVGLSVVGVVVALLLIQSAFFIYWTDRGGTGPRPSQLRTAMTVAEAVGRRLETGAPVDLDALVAASAAGEHVPERSLSVVLRDGTAIGAGGATVSDPVRRTAALMLAGAAPRPGDDVGGGGPATYAPIQVRGELRGVVIVAPPPAAGFARELGRVLTPSTWLLLLGLTATAAIAVVRPVRRRLAGLEAAAGRVALGDLSAHAPEDGRDEVARVGAAFNRMRTELAARDAALQAADRTRRQLLADVSHELKTPLTAMRGFLETLQMDDGRLDPDRRQRYLETVVEETRRMDRIVADLVDLARLEHRGNTLDVRVFAPARLFERVVRRHEEDARRRRIAMRVAVTESADQLHGDPHRLEQVIENLAGNALRYVSDGGVITLSAAVDGEAGVLTVADTGAGIPAEHLGRIFERFYKADSARAAGSAGSGLGLSIVKAIVDRHGGTIDVTSRPGHTVFTVRLPGAAVATDDAPVRPQPASANL